MSRQGINSLLCLLKFNQNLYGNQEDNWNFIFQIKIYKTKGKHYFVSVIQHIPFFFISKIWQNQLYTIRKQNIGYQNFPFCLPIGHFSCNLWIWKSTSGKMHLYSEVQTNQGKKALMHVYSFGILKLIPSLISTGHWYHLRGD